MPQNPSLPSATLKNSKLKTQNSELSPQSPTPYWTSLGLSCFSLHYFALLRSVGFQCHLQPRVSPFHGNTTMGFQLPSHGIQSMLKEGHKHLSGLDEAVLKNIDACKQLSTITRTSLGPNGMFSLAASFSHFFSFCVVCSSLNQNVTHPSSVMWYKPFLVLFKVIFGSLYASSEGKGRGGGARFPFRETKLSLTTDGDTLHSRSGNKSYKGWVGKTINS